MAKDGTARGGLRAGAGRKPKDLKDKLLEGKDVSSLSCAELPEAPDLEGNDMPEVADWLRETQYDGKEWQAEELALRVHAWLRERGCDHLVTDQQVYSYAVSQARWIQCQRAISEYGFIQNHPTHPDKKIESPYVKMADQFGKAAAAAWFLIYQIVRENSAERYEGSSREATMADLLSD